MGIFQYIDDNKLIEIQVDKTGSFPTIALQVFKLPYKKPIFISKKIIIAKRILEELPLYLKEGDVNLSANGFDLLDADRSYICIFDNRTQILFHMYNLISKQIDEINLKNIDPQKLANYLML